MRKTYRTDYEKIALAARINGGICDACPYASRVFGRKVHSMISYCVRSAIISALCFVGMAGQSLAADLDGYVAIGGRCLVSEDSALLQLTNTSTIRDEVRQRYEHASDIANSHRWIYSARPAFIWATEARQACGTAIGYLKSGHISEEVGKCDCFYSRMLSHMN